MPGVQGSVGGKPFRLQGGRPCFSRLRGLSKNTGQGENVALTAAIKSIPFPKNTKRVAKAPSQKSKAGLNTCLLLIEKFCLSSYKNLFIFVQINIGIDIHIDNVTDVDVEALRFRFETQERANCIIYLCKLF